MSDVDLVDLHAAVDFIRPRLRGHAGDMQLEIGIDDSIDVLFTGACESCPAMAVTFAGLVRTRLMEVGGVTGVTATQVHASPRTLNNIARRLGARVVEDG